MSFESARNLVTRLKGDREFRDRIRRMDDFETIWQTIRTDGYDCSPVEVQLAYNRYG
jgi:hypothetical protein